MNLKELFISMLRVGCIGFGGGSALIPVLHKTYVEEKEIISETEYEEDVVVASITPGALTIKLAGEIGRRIAGWKGMLVASSAMALPGVLLTSLILSVMSGLNTTFVRQIEFLTIGVMAYIVCMLSDYVYKTITTKKEKNELKKTVIMTVLVFVLTCGKNLYRLLGITEAPLFSLATLDIFIMTFFVILFIGNQMTKGRVLVSVVLCIAYVCCASKRGFIQNEMLFSGTKLMMLALAVYGLRDQMKNVFFRKLKWREVGIEVGVMLSAVMISLIPALFVSKDALIYAGNGLLSAVMSFGGGDAYLTVADGLFVGTGVVSEDAFYGSIVPVVNILPGSILCKALSGIGYVVGFSQTDSVIAGYVMALVGLTCSFAASCGVVSIVGCLYRGFGELAIFQSVKQWIRPIVSGLMLNVILSLVYQSRATGIAEGMNWNCVLVMLVTYMMNVVLFYKKKTSSIFMVVCSVVLSLVLCNLLLMV